MNITLFDEINKYTPKRRRMHSEKYDNGKDNTLFRRNTSTSTWNILIFAFIVLLVVFIFVGRAVEIQLTNRQKYLGLAEKNRIREFSIFPARGVIYDRNNKVLVRNKPAFSIQINTLICGQAKKENSCREIINEVVKHVELKEIDYIEKQLVEKRQNIVLAANLNREEILSLEANLSKLPGVVIEATPARDYLLGESISHLIGYVGLGDEDLTPVIVGKTGIEEYYDKQLSGIPGNKIVQVDSLGTTYNLISQKSPLPGKNIHLSIDMGLQVKAYEILKNKIEGKESTATGGAIVAQDPTTGEILALVSYPSFDPNKLSGVITSREIAELNSNPNFPFFNRVISATYPPGSTFKLVTASAALMEGVVTKYTSVFDPGYIQVGSFIFRNWNTAGHGDVNMVRALQVSNDTYFYTVVGGHANVSGIGIAKLAKWASLFGFGEMTGIDLGGEVAGFMPDGTHRDWYLGDNYISGIGQGDILATPLQINNMLTYFANGGILFQPKIVHSIDGVGELKGKILQKNIINGESYDVIREGINKAVESGGTGWPLFDFSVRHNGIHLAGKTGTSEYISVDGKEMTHAWFSIFGPYFDDEVRQAEMAREDKPIVLTVFLEGGGSGSDDAAPLAKDLLDMWFE